MPNPNDVAVALGASDRQRLISLLAMTSSTFDNEALIATRMANRTIKSAGITWAEVVDKSPSREPQIYEYAPRDLPRYWRWICCAILESNATLQRGEAKFLRQITVYRCSAPTREQLWKLRCIADRVLKKTAPT